jgi:hypothetical protein
MRRRPHSTADPPPNASPPRLCRQVRRSCSACVRGHRPCVRHPSGVCERCFRMSRRGRLIAPCDLPLILSTKSAGSSERSVLVGANAVVSQWGEPGDSSRADLPTGSAALDGPSKTPPPSTARATNEPPPSTGVVVAPGSQVSIEGGLVPVAPVGRTVLFLPPSVHPSPPGVFGNLRPAETPPPPPSLVASCDPGGAAASFTCSRNANCDPGGAKGTRVYPTEGGSLDGYCFKRKPDSPSSLAF